MKVRVALAVLLVLGLCWFAQQRSQLAQRVSPGEWVYPFNQETSVPGHGFPLEMGGGTGGLSTDGRIVLAAGLSEGLSGPPGNLPFGGAIALSAGTGAVLWTNPNIGRPAYGAPTLAGDVSYVVAHPGVLREMRNRDGAVIRSLERPDSVWYPSLLYDADRVYGRVRRSVGKNGLDTICAVSTRTFHPVWQTGIDLVSSRVLDARNGLLYAVSARYGLVAIDARTGVVKRSLKIPKRLNLLNAGGVDRLICAGGSGIICVDTKEWKTLWRRSEPVSVGHGCSLAFDGSRSYCMVTNVSQIEAIDVATGRAEWTKAIVDELDPSIFVVAPHWLIYFTRPRSTKESESDSLYDERPLSIHFMDTRSGQDRRVASIVEPTEPLSRNNVAVAGSVWIATKHSIVKLRVPLNG
jgi:outer membrane protein assembly factor BamB